MTCIALGFNCNCFTNRFEEPEEWTRLCREMGVHKVMFNIDLVDPYWPWDLQRKLCDRTLEACTRNGVAIVCSFGGHHGHQHYLGHPDPLCRREAEKFFRRAIRQTAYLGGRSFGTCFAIQSVRTHQDPALREEIMESAFDSYSRLAAYAAELGLTSLSYEMTSVGRETCATFAENDRVLARGMEMAIPLRVCLDLGHRNLHGSAEEADHLAWIRRYGSRSTVIDCQQTDAKSSTHWPFTEEYNRRGVVRGEEVIRAIQDSGAKEILLAFEIRIAAFHPQEYAYGRSLEESVMYWRRWVHE